MKIQIITAARNVKALEDENVGVRSFNKPLSFDDFDIVIIDLSDDSIWEYSGDSKANINMSKDFVSLELLARTRNNCKIIYLLPQNSTFYYYKYSSGAQYSKRCQLKDMLDILQTNLLSLVITYGSSFPFDLIFEPTTTRIGDNQYNCDFCFKGSQLNILTMSEVGRKPTTIEKNNVYYTTLSVLFNRGALDTFLTEIGLTSKKEKNPDWLSNIKVLDDKDIEELVVSLVAEEREIVVKKNSALQRLAKNNEYKSILFSTGEQLVTVVFEILEEVLGCSLKGFIDIKKEDFLIKLLTITFIGEIKGVGTNVKNAHVSQTDVHTQTYKDELAEKGVNEEVKSILIINPFRVKALTDREPVAQAQIELAEKHNCLIITTEVLLRLFEKFRRSELNCEQVIKILRERSGLLNLD